MQSKFSYFSTQSGLFFQPSVIWSPSNSRLCWGWLLASVLSFVIGSSANAQVCSFGASESGVVDNKENPNEKVTTFSKVTVQELLFRLEKDHQFSAADLYFRRLKILYNYLFEEGIDQGGYSLPGAEKCGFYQVNEGQLGNYFLPVARDYDLTNGLNCANVKRTLAGLLFTHMDFCNQERLSDLTTSGASVTVNFVGGYSDIGGATNEFDPEWAAGIAFSINSDFSSLRDALVVDPEIFDRRPTNMLRETQEIIEFVKSGGAIGGAYRTALVRLSYDPDGNQYSWLANTQSDRSIFEIAGGPASDSVGSQLILGNVLAKWEQNGVSSYATMFPIAELEQNIPGPNTILNKAIKYRDYVFWEWFDPDLAAQNPSISVSLNGLMKASAVSMHYYPSTIDQYGNFGPGIFSAMPLRDQFLRKNGLNRNDFPPNVADFIFGPANN